MSVIEIKVSAELNNERLDVFLLNVLRNSFNHSKYLSRALVQDYIHQGVYRKMSDKKSIIDQSSYEVKEGEVFYIDTKIINELLKIKRRRITGKYEIIPQKGQLDIVYEDANILVLNKKSGVVVHPGISNPKDTLANYVKYYLMEKDQYDDNINKVGIVHRLDKEVSGLIVVAKRVEVQEVLFKAFKDRLIQKYYLASVEKIDKYKDLDFLQIGEWNRVEGTICRDNSNRLRRKFYINEKKNNGKWSITNIYPYKQDKFIINIVTGRNHQIRAVLRGLHYYITGDSLYGKADRNNNTFGLRSVLLELPNMSIFNKSRFILDTIGADVKNIIFVHLESIAS